MSTATTVIPAHGTEGRYKGRRGQPGCRCSLCTRAVGKAVEIRRLDRLAGNPRRIPAAPLIAHLAVLRGAGMSWAQIGKAASTSASTPREIYVEKFPTVLRSTAEKLLAVTPHRRPQAGFVRALGASRRLQALYALGHGHQFLVIDTGVSSSCIIDLITGRNTSIDVAIDTRIRETFERHSMTVGSNTRTLARARREGWPPPLAWDDIDDPAAIPNLVKDGDAFDPIAIERALKGQHVPLTKREQLHVTELLTVDGWTEKAIAELTGRSDRTIGRWRRANGWTAAA